MRLPILQVVNDRKKFRRRVLASHEELLTRNTATKDVPVHHKKLVILMYFSFDLISVSIPSWGP